MAILKDLAEGRTPWGLPVFCIPEFLRVVTHSRIFSPPSSLKEANLFVDRLLSSPSLRVLVPGKNFWHHLKASSEAAQAVGNLMFDAQIAAVCLEHGTLDLITADRDFSRFPELNPSFLTA